MKQANANIDGEIVIPESTIFSEHPVVVVDRNVTSTERPVVDAFINYLFTDEAQRAFVKFHFRSSTNEALDQENKELATIKYPFTVDYFGGWERPTPKLSKKSFATRCSSESKLTEHGGLKQERRTVDAIGWFRVDPRRIA
jgi:ABC-type sulfate transport system substrate-binding protein